MSVVEKKKYIQSNNLTKTHTFKCEISLGTHIYFKYKCLALTM